jgi:hypothetical protein
VFSPKNHDGMPHSVLISKRFLFEEKHGNCPRKIVPMTPFSKDKMRAISAEKVGISLLTENSA